jgi:hypothetical protein
MVTQSPDIPINIKQSLLSVENILDLIGQVTALSAAKNRTLRLRMPAPVVTIPDEVGKVALFIHLQDRKVGCIGLRR